MDRELPQRQVQCGVCNLRLRYTPQEEKSEQLHQSRQSSHGGKDASGDEADDEGLQTYGSNLPGDAEEDRCRRGLHACHRQGGVGSTQGTACIPKGNYTILINPWTWCRAIRSNRLL